MKDLHQKVRNYKKSKNKNKNILKISCYEKLG